MKKIIIIIVVVVIVGIGAYYFVSNSNSSKINNNSATTGQIPTTKSSAINTTNNSSDLVIKIKDFSFNPAEQTIKIGTKVTWVNEDSAAHTITSDSGTALNSKTLAPGGSFSFTFTDPGSINYHCAIHPSMKGVITIKN